MAHITASDLQQMFADVADAGAYRCFEYQGIAVGFHSDEPDLLNWFDKFFGGYFTVTASERANAVVYSSQDPAVFHRLKEWATASGRPRSEHETEYAIDAQHRIIYSREVDEAKGKVEENCFVLAKSGRNVLVSSPGTLKDRQKAVKRSLRNMMKLLFMEKGLVSVPLGNVRLERHRHLHPRRQIRRQDQHARQPARPGGRPIRQQ